VYSSQKNIIVPLLPSDRSQAEMKSLLCVYVCVCAL